jgi:hypothetical protein
VGVVEIVEVSSVLKGDQTDSNRIKIVWNYNILLSITKSKGKQRKSIIPSKG